MLPGILLMSILNMYEYKQKKRRKKYLEKIKQKTNYGRWFFGHYHMDHQITTQDAVIYHQITRIF